MVFIESALNYLWEQSAISLLRCEELIILYNSKDEIIYFPFCYIFYCCCYYYCLLKFLDYLTLTSLVNSVYCCPAMI